MQIASAALGSIGLGSVLQDPGAITDPLAARPILTEHNGVDARAFIAMDSILITDTLGQPVTASFTMIDPTPIPVVGDRIRIMYYSQVLFAGTIDHVTKTSPNLITILYHVECLDWSQTLIRRKIRRTFTNATASAIVASMLSNELAGESLSLGTIESAVRLPLVEAKNARVFDVLRDVAGALGQTFYIEFDQSIQMRSLSVQSAPLLLNEGNVLLDSTAIQVDRETYRNTQTVVVTGTAAADVEPVVVIRTAVNQDQIDERQAIEGGTGIYEEIEEITHPTSNDETELSLLAVGYTVLRLATSGIPRAVVRCQVRGYGFRAGQVATVDLPTFGLAGSYVVQRVSIREQAGAQLFHDLELTSSSGQQRAYESWLAIVRTGKVTVQIPTSLGSNNATFTTPGADTWTVPAGVTVAVFTCIGGSGGGGHGLCSAGGPWFGSGNGGNSGKAVSVVVVIAGEVYDVTVGAKGVVVVGNNGTAGTDSTVARAGVVLSKGNGSAGGKKVITSPSCATGPNGAAGSGTGDTVTVGGGKSGGRGSVNPDVIATNGKDGSVSIDW